MKSRRMLKTSARFGALLIFLFVLLGCREEAEQITGDITNSESGSEHVDEAKPMNPAMKEVRLFIPGISEQEQFMNEYGQKISERFPEITPVLVPFAGVEQLTSKMIYREMPDVIYTDPSATFLNILNHELQYDIDDLIRKYDLDLKQFQPSAIEWQRELAGGGIYGLPADLRTVVLYYNKSLFDRFGQDYPTDGMTWDEAYDLAVKMSRVEGDQSYYGLFYGMDQMMHYNPYSLPIVNMESSRPQIDISSWSQYFVDMLRLYDIPNIEMPKNLVIRPDWVSNLFSTEQSLAMKVGLNLDWRLFPEDLDWDVVTLPTLTQFPDRGPQALASYYYLSNESEEKDAAFEVILYLTSPEFQISRVEQGFLSALLNADLHKNYGLAMNIEGKNISALTDGNYAPSAPISQYDDMAKSTMLVAYFDIVRLDLDVEARLRQAAESFQAEIGRME